MSMTISRRIVEAVPGLEGIADAVQPKVQAAVGAAGTPVRNVLDGTILEAPLHPMVTDVPMGSWSATMVFDILDLLTGSRPLRNAADATLVLGILGSVAAATTGLSDWRYLSGESRRMGVAHGLLNTVGLALNAGSLGLRAAGRRNAARLAFVAGFSITGTAAHLGGELSYNYGLRVNRNVFEPGGPDEFVPVMDEAELPPNGMKRVEAGDTSVLLSRSGDGSICAISNVCNHFSAPLDEGVREGDTVVCPWHDSRFDLCTGEAIDGPATFPQSRYETRVRDGKVEIKGAEENIQKRVR